MHGGGVNDSGPRVVAGKTVAAWDWPTRAFHWLLVVLLGCAWVSFQYANALGDPLLKWHRWNGYAILVLVVFRLLWGVVGSSTSRFEAFVTWPWTTARYAVALFKGQARPYLSHNPLGTWMILLLLGGVLAQGILGLYALEHNEIVAGPLMRTISFETAEAVTKLHVQGFYLLLVFVAVHVLTNLAYAFLKREPLLRAMITGKKPTDDYVDQQEATVVPRVGVRAAVCLGVAASIVFGGIVVLGGRL